MLLKRKTAWLLCAIVFLGAIFLFLYRMWQVGSVAVWLFTDVLLIASVLGDLTQDIFTSYISRVNTTALRKGVEPFLGRPVLFVGFFFGLTLGAVASSYVMIFLFLGDTSQLSNPFLFLSLTSVASVLILGDFLRKFRA